MRTLVVALILAAATPASADVFKLAAEVDAGGLWGTGYAGDQKANAFFAKSPPFAYGAIISGELFGLLDAYIQHHEFTDGNRITTWTQFGAGIHFQVSLADPKVQAQNKGGFFEAGVALFFGIGTGQEVMPPLDNAQITDKAFLAEGRLGIGTHLNHVVDLGIGVPVSWGYFFKNGVGVGANNANNQYQGVQGEVLGFIRFNIHLL
jgi:hypothetical protein